MFRCLSPLCTGAVSLHRSSRQSAGWTLPFGPFMGLNSWTPLSTVAMLQGSAMYKVYRLYMEQRYPSFQSLNVVTCRMVQQTLQKSPHIAVEFSNWPHSLFINIVNVFVFLLHTLRTCWFKLIFTFLFCRFLFCIVRNV